MARANNQDPSSTPLSISINQRFIYLLMHKMFEKTVNCLHKLGIEDITIYRQPANIHYKSCKNCNDILYCLSTKLEEKLKGRLSNCFVLTSLANQCTDIPVVNVEQLDTCTLNWSDNMKPNTQHVNNIGCKDWTGAGTAFEILSSFNDAK